MPRAAVVAQDDLFSDTDYSELKSTDTDGTDADRMLSFDEFNRLIGLDDVAAAEARYEPKRRG